MKEDAPYSQVELYMLQVFDKMGRYLVGLEPSTADDEHREEPREEQTQRQAPSSSFVISRTLSISGESAY